MTDQRLKTTDAPIGGITYKYWLLRVPDVDLIRSAIRGALWSIAFWSNWVQDGDMTPEDTAHEIKQMILGINDMDFLIGTIVMSNRNNMDAELLVCNGATYLRADYPELWARTPIPDRTPADFIVPDMRGVFPVGRSAGIPLRSTGGAEEVTLSIAQVPPHEHFYDKPIAGLDVEGVGVPDPLAISNPMLPTLTSSAGGGLAHENMPPYYAIHFFIIAKFQ